MCVCVLWLLGESYFKNGLPPLLSLSFPFLRPGSGFSALCLTLTSLRKMARGVHGIKQASISRPSCIPHSSPYYLAFFCISLSLCLPSSPVLSLCLSSAPFISVSPPSPPFSSLSPLFFFFPPSQECGAQKQLSGGMLLQQAHTQPQGREPSQHARTHACTYTLMTFCRSHLAVAAKQ